MLSCGLFHKDGEVLDVRPEPIYFSSVQTQDVVQKTCRIRCNDETRVLEQWGMWSTPSLPLVPCLVASVRVLSMG